MYIVLVFKHNVKVVNIHFNWQSVQQATILI